MHRLHVEEGRQQRAAPARVRARLVFIRRDIRVGKSKALERPVFGRLVVELQLAVDPGIEERRTVQEERSYRDAAAILNQDGVQQTGSPKAAPEQAADHLAGFDIQLAHRYVERIVRQGHVLDPVLLQREL